MGSHIGAFRPSPYDQGDVVPGLNHADGGPGLVVGIVFGIQHRLTDLPVCNQHRPEGKHLRCPRRQVFLRRHRVADIGLHAPVPVNRQRVQIRPGALLGAVPGFRRQDLSVPDHDPVILVFLQPDTVQVVRHGKHAGMRLQQQFRTYQLVSRRPLLCRLGHHRPQRLRLRRPNFRHAVFPGPGLLLVLSRNLLPESANGDGQVRAGILPQARFLVLQDVFFPGSADQEPLSVQFPCFSALRSLRRCAPRPQRQCQNHGGQAPDHPVPVHGVFSLFI